MNISEIKALSSPKPDKDYWLIACVPDNEQVIYLDWSDDAVEILVNGDWEDDGLFLPVGHISPGVYKFQLFPRREWDETDMKIIKVMWNLNNEES